VHRVTSLINNPDSSLLELVEVIRLDQAITANILRMCNSAYFGLRHKVDNVHDAIMYLGKQNVVRAVLAAGTSRFFKDTPGYEAEAKDLWEHAVGSALMSQILAKKILKHEDSQLFTAALLHDIGKIILGEFVREKYHEIKNLMSVRSCSFLEAGEEVLGVNHAGIGGAIAAA
jgi:HD-like signal output (HDOD) protein